MLATPSAADGVMTPAAQGGNVSRMAGRPTKYSAALADSICELLAGGMGELGIEKLEGMPTRQTMRMWRRENEDFLAQCTRARIDQGHSVADSIEDIEAKAMAGEVDAAVARCVISSRQWRASKLAPKSYGERMTLAGDPENPLGQESDEQLDARLTELLAKRGAR